MGEQGVTIGLREIYDTMQEVAHGVRTLNDRVGRLEESAKKTDEIEDVSKAAHQKAKDALEKIDNLNSHITWLWRTIAGAIIASGVGYTILHWH